MAFFRPVGLWLAKFTGSGMMEIVEYFPCGTGKEIRRLVVLLNECKQKLELEYPCPWVYKIIGREQGELRAAIAEVVQARECLVSLSNSSSGGKYLCLDVEIVVISAEDRECQYCAFKGHPAVVMVL
jgi:putative lipoic acid-binding regulatory protein